MKVQMQRLVGLVVPLSLAALIVGSAQGGTSEGSAVPDAFERAVARASDGRTVHPNDRAGRLGVGGSGVTQPIPDAFERAAARGGGDGLVLPNDRAGKLGVGGVESGNHAVPDAFERAVIRSYATDSSPSTSLATTPDGGFQWGDAAYGAAAVFGIVLLGGAAAMTLRHRGRVILP